MLKATLSRMIVLAFASLVLGQPAYGDSTAVSAAYPESVVKAIQAMGYKAELTIDDYGDPLVLSAAHGVGFSVIFYGCENGTDCTDLQFSVAFDLLQGLDYVSMNSWNAERVMGTAYLDRNNDPVFQYFVSQVDGMSRHNFDKTYEFWVEMLGEFMDFIGW